MKQSKEKKQKNLENNQDDNFLSVDELSLDKDWSIQARLAKKWHLKLAQARDKLDTAKDQLEYIKSKLTVDIREDPASFGLRKATDKSIEAATVIHDRFQSAKEEVRQAKKEVGEIEAVTTAIEHKKKALEKMVDLWTMGYFSEPRASSNSRETLTDLEMRRLSTRGRKRSSE